MVWSAPDKGKTAAKILLPWPLVPAPPYDFLSFAALPQKEYRPVPKPKAQFRHSLPEKHAKKVVSVMLILTGLSLTLQNISVLSTLFA